MKNCNSSSLDSTVQYKHACSKVGKYARLSVAFVMALVLLTSAFCVSWGGGSAIVGVVLRAQEMHNNIARRVEGQELDAIAMSQYFDNDYERACWDMYGSFGDEASDLRIEQIKTLQDFAGNDYYVVEFEPHGYAVYDSTFSQAVEINAAAQSPWYGMSGELIYGGATYYYVKPDLQPKSGAWYQHTVRAEEMLVDALEQQELADVSNEMYVNVATRVAELESLKHVARASDWQEVSVPQAALMSNTDANSQFNTTDFNDDGNCGYVAAAVLLRYAELVLGWNIPHSFGPDLVKVIQNGRPNDSWASDVSKALNEYFGRYGIDKLSSLATLPTLGELYDYISNQQPIALFGTVRDVQWGDDAPSQLLPINHAIVVHRMERWHYVNLWIIHTYDHYWMNAHFGWDTVYNNVKVWESMIRGSCSRISKY